MTIPETRFSSSSVGSANNTELKITKIHLCQLFLSWLIGIPEHRYEIKETIEQAQSGGEETELRSVRLQNKIKEVVGSISWSRTNIEGLKITENASEGTAALIPCKQLDLRMTQKSKKLRSHLQWETSKQGHLLHLLLHFYANLIHCHFNKEVLFR